MSLKTLRISLIHVLLNVPWIAGICTADSARSHPGHIWFGAYPL